MNIIYLFCTVLSHLVAADLSSSVHHLFLHHELTDLQPWRTVVDGLQSFNVSRIGEDGEYETATGIFLKSNGDSMGNIYILRNKESERVISISFFSKGKTYVMTQSGRRNVEDMRIREVVRFTRRRVTHAPPKKDKTLLTSHLNVTATSRAKEDMLNVDQSGIIIDVLFFFSVAAKSIVEETLTMSLDEYANIQKLMFESSMSNVNLRILDCQAISQDIAVNEKNLIWFKNNSLSRKASTGADLIVFFTNGTQAGPSSAVSVTTRERDNTLLFVDDLNGWTYLLKDKEGLNKCPDPVTVDDGTIVCRDNSWPDNSLEIHPLDSHIPEQRLLQISQNSIGMLPSADHEPASILQGKWSGADQQMLEWNVGDDIYKMIIRVQSEKDAEPFSLFVSPPDGADIFEADQLISTRHLKVVSCPASGEWRAWLTGEGSCIYKIAFYKNHNSSTSCASNETNGDTSQSVSTDQESLMSTTISYED